MSFYSLVEGLTLNDEEDIIWAYSSKGNYSVQSLYALVNCRGVLPIYVQAVWKLNIPPRVQFFLWLVSHNRLLTRDDLQKQREVNDKSCLFCSELESVSHLLFDCFVLKHVWLVIPDILNMNIGGSYESVAKFWVANKKHVVTNFISAAVMWTLWKLGNEMCFQGLVWPGFKTIWMRIARMLRGWWEEAQSKLAKTDRRHYMA
jgi:hypothetical protein